ncbi:hypothetical protein P3342_006118 [Pyrenophora teres f. teres]|nr:hypothetical protein P3342_006118 [Pyrenophora teres f. teres]
MEQEPGRTPPPPLRSLLPAPAGGIRREAVEKHKPARVNACEACRIRKSKCDNVKPKCTACVVRDSECRHSETESRQFKRKYQQLKEKRTAQEELFDMLQNMPEKDAANVFNRIRAGANAEAIVQHVQEGSLVMELSNVPKASPRFHFPYVDSIPPRLRESVYFQSRIYEAIDAYSQGTGSPKDPSVSRQSNYANPILAAKIIESSLDVARISHWTNVCSNDHLLRNLLYGYLIHQYPKHHFFHKGYFLEDMVSKSSEFCSPLLMNAILAKACVSQFPNICQPHQILGPGQFGVSLPG